MRRRLVPLSLGLLVGIIGMAYSLLWGPVIRHKHYWIAPGDLWLTVRSAHYVGWGALSYIYGSHSALVSLPGFPILLTPAVMLSSALGLTENYPILNLFTWHPTAWLLLGPVTFMFGATLLFAMDDVARALTLPNGRRNLLLAMEAAVLWPVIALWGHPEDMLALALVLWSVISVRDQRWTVAGWQFGGALAVQPLALLALPAIFAWVGWRRGSAFVARAAILPVVLVVAVAVPNFGESIRALTTQANYPGPNHPTPWILVAPSISKVAVAAGPARLGAIVAALVIGAWVYRAKLSFGGILWAVMIAFAVRCVFEAVMVTYYVVPAIMLALVIAASRRITLALVALVGAIVTLVSYWHEHNMWTWYGALSGALVVIAGLSWTGAKDWSRPASEDHSREAGIRDEPGDLSGVPAAVPV